MKCSPNININIFAARPRLEKKTIPDVRLFIRYTNNTIGKKDFLGALYTQTRWLCNFIFIIFLLFFSFSFFSAFLTELVPTRQACPGTAGTRFYVVVQYFIYLFYVLRRQPSVRDRVWINNDRCLDSTPRAYIFPIIYTRSSSPSFPVAFRPDLS